MPEILCLSSSFLKFNLYNLELPRSKHNDIVRRQNFIIVNEYVVHLCYNRVGVNEEDSDYYLIHMGSREREERRNALSWASNCCIKLVIGPPALKPRLVNWIAQTRCLQLCHSLSLDSLGILYWTQFTRDKGYSQIYRCYNSSGFILEFIGWAAYANSSTRRIIAAGSSEDCWSREFPENPRQQASRLVERIILDRA